MHVGGNAVEVKTEADSDDMTECPHDDQPTSGMFGFIFSYSTLCPKKSAPPLNMSIFLPK